MCNKNKGKQEKLVHPCRETGCLVDALCLPVDALPPNRTRQEEIHMSIKVVTLGGGGGSATTSEDRFLSDRDEPLGKRCPGFTDSK